MTQQNHKDMIQRFKSFINRHPYLLEKVRREGKSWQSYYEKWVLLGEEDPYWEQFRNVQHSQRQDQSSSRELFEQFSNMIDKVDVPKLQKQVGELSNIIQTIDGLLTNYLRSRKESTRTIPYDHYHRFKD